ncbi:hypothetical protein BgiMline_033432 [Biomphalaria glabrata]
MQLCKSLKDDLLALLDDVREEKVVVVALLSRFSPEPRSTTIVEKTGLVVETGAVDETGPVDRTGLVDRTGCCFAVSLKKMRAKWRKKRMRRLKRKRRKMRARSK